MTEQGKDPYLDAGMRGFIVNTAKREFWRVASWYELEDLIQDGYLCYYKCRNRYTQLSVKNHPTKGDKKWMLCLVRTTYLNHIRHTLAGKMLHGCEMVISQMGVEDLGLDDVWAGIAPPQSEEATLAVMLAQAPSEIKQLICLLVGDGSEALGFSRSRNRISRTASGKVLRVRRGRRQLRETTNEYYCRLMGLDPGRYDLLGLVRGYFSVA